MIIPSFRRLNINERKSKLNRQRELDLSSLSPSVCSGRQTELKFDKVLSKVIRNSMKDTPKDMKLFTIHFTANNSEASLRNTNIFVGVYGIVQFLLS